MGKLKWNIVEDSFSLNSSSSYDLSILVGIDRFFYTIIDETSRILVFRDYSFSNKGSFLLLKSPLKLTLVNDKLLGLNYKTTKIGLLSRASSLVPEPLFEESGFRQYLDNSQETLDTDNVAFDSINEIEAMNVYGFDAEIWRLLNTYFPKAKFFHASTPLLTALKKLPEFQSGKHLFINVVGQVIQIVHFDSGKLMFYNTFTYQTANDFIYFIMLVIEQLGLRPEKIPTTVSGEIMDDSGIYHQLKRYIKVLEFNKRPSFLKFSENFEKIPPHFFFDLFSLKLCA